jgi:hypothetical protein
VPGVDVDERDLLGLAELGDIAGVDPCLGLVGAVFGAHDEYGNVKASVVAQPYDAGRDSLRDGNSQRDDEVSVGSAEVGRVGALERSPTREGHDAVDGGEEVGIGVAVGGREATHQRKMIDRIGSLVSDHPRQGARGRVSHNHGSVRCIDRLQGRGELVGKRRSGRGVIDAGQSHRHRPVPTALQFATTSVQIDPGSHRPAMRMMSMRRTLDAALPVRPHRSTHPGRERTLCKVLMNGTSAPGYESLRHHRAECRFPGRREMCW